MSTIDEVRAARNGDSLGEVKAARQGLPDQEPPMVETTIESKPGVELVRQEPGELVEKTNRLGLKETPVIRAGTRTKLESIKASGKTILRGLDYGRMFILVDQARKPEWSQLIGPMILGADTPAGEEAFRAWPDNRTIRRRIQAVTEADLGAMKTAGLEKELSFVVATGGPLAAQKFIRDSYATGKALRPEEEEIQSIEAQITEDEMKPWFSIVFPAINPLTGRIIKPSGALDPIGKAAQDFLDAHGNSNDAIALVQRIAEQNAANGVDMESKTGFELVVQEGIGMAGFDIVTTIADPLGFIPLGAPVRGINAALRLINHSDELTRVGHLNKLTNLWKQEANMLKDLQSHDPVQAMKQARRAGNKRAEIAQHLNLDPELAADAAALSEKHGDLVVQVRQGLPEQFADEAIAISASGRKGKKLTEAMEDRVRKLQPNMTPENVTAKAQELIDGTAPLRAWRSYLKQHEAFEASTTGFQNRHTALKNAYEETFQRRAAVEQETLEAIELLVKDPDKAYEVVNDLRVGAKDQQRVIEDLAQFVETRGDKKLFRGIAHHSILGKAKRSITDLHIFEPKTVLGGTETWNTLSSGDRRHTKRLEDTAEFMRERFGFLTKKENLDLNRRLTMAGDGRLTDLLDDGSRKYLYQTSDDAGKIVRSDEVILSADEAIVLDRGRAIFDEFAVELRDAGVKGFEKGKPVIQDYFPRLFRKEMLKDGIPEDMLDVVNPNVMFRHALPRVMREQLAEESVPLFTDVLEAYTRGAIRKLEFEPALKQALKSSKELRPMQQSYVNDLIKVLKGQPGKLEKGLDLAIDTGLDMARRIPGVAIKEINRPAYKLSLGLSRAFHRSLLGGMFSSGMYNFGQSINTASRFGVMPTLRGLARHLTKEGRQEFEDARIMSDMVEFFGNPNKFNDRIARMSGGILKNWDDVLMAPIHVTEHHNRGIAFHTGMGLALDKRGIRSYQQMKTLPEKIRKEILAEAIDAVETTQFIYGKLGMSPLFQQPGMRNATTLVTFPAKQAQFMVQQMKDDPTGIARYLIMSGWITRMNREMLGIDADHAFGFGFIPDDIGPMPIAGPEINMLWNVGLAMASNSPREQKQIMNELYGQMSQLVAGAVAGRVPLALLGAVPARDVESFLDGTIPGAPDVIDKAGNLVRDASEYIPGVGPDAVRLADSAIEHGINLAGNLSPTGGFPELERDLGSRFATRILQAFRRTADWASRDANNRLIREMTPREVLIEATGLRTQASSDEAFDADMARRRTNLTDFNVDESITNYLMEVTGGDDNEAQEILAEAQQDIEMNEIFDGRSISSRIKAGLLDIHLSRSQRILLRNPGLMATPEGRNIQNRQ